MILKNQIFLIFLTFCTLSLSAQYTFDGDYCPGPGETDDEYANAVSIIVDPMPSSTCEIGTVWGGLSNEPSSDLEIFVGLYHGNSGQSTFRFYFNTDCDPMTGALEDFEKGNSGATVNVGGAEFRITITSNGSTTTIEEWDSTSAGFVTTTVGVNADVGNSDGCTGSDGQFKEIIIPVVSDFFDICNSTSFCGSVELTTVLSNAGGSPNSNFCQSSSISIEVDINEPPIANFVAEDVCEEENGGLGGTFPSVMIPAIGSSDADLANNNDFLEFEWTSSVAGDIFDPATGTNITSISDINTLFTPSSLGTRVLSLSLIDSYGCNSTTSTSDVAYEINILPWEDDACLILPIELAHFGAKMKSNHTVELFWETSSEVNASHFVLERKTSNATYEEVTIIETGGQENLPMKYYYEDVLHSDLRDRSTNILYRLKEVDKDGSFDYSKTVLVSNNGGKNTLTIKTNPIVNQEIELDLSAFESTQISSIYLYDLTGRIQKEISLNDKIEKGNYNFFIDVSELKAGIYFIHTILNSKPFSQRIVIL